MLNGTHTISKDHCFKHKASDSTRNKCKWEFLLHMKRFFVPHEYSTVLHHLSPLIFIQESRYFKIFKLTSKSSIFFPQTLKLLRLPFFKTNSHSFIQCNPTNYTYIIWNGEFMRSSLSRCIQTCWKTEESKEIQCRAYKSQLIRTLI